MPTATDIRIEEWKPELFPKSKSVSGSSPWAYTLTEGPSYIAPENRQAPLEPSGIFKEEYGKHGRDLSPLLGVEYTDDIQLADFITAYLDESATAESRKKARNIIRDIAIEISRKGVAVFRHQHKLTVQNQKDFINQLGVLSGRPKENGLHIHPQAQAGGVVGEDGLIDKEVFLVPSTIDKSKKFPYSNRRNIGAWNSSAWHTDIAFEVAPADYTALKIITRPPEGSGGDTVYANGYALYERFSKPYQEFLKGLTGTYSLPSFQEFVKEEGIDVYTDRRGAPENVGSNLDSHHPLVRTNPVTGWNSIFGIGLHFTKVNELSAIESQKYIDFIHDTLVNSHDLQTRISWTSDNDIIIWDNRSTFHTATTDFKGYRRGIRTISIGERPYLDPKGGVQSEAIYKEIEEKTGALN